MITGLSLGGIPILSSKVWLTNFNNASFPATVYSKTKRGGYSGTKLVTPQFASYQLVMDLVIIGDTYTDLLAQRKNLFQTLGLIHSLGAQTLIITRSDGVNLQIDIKAVEVTGDMTTDDVTSSKIEVTLSAEYPFLQNAIPQSNDVLLTNGGGIKVPMTLPMPMSGGSIPNVQVINNGNYSAYPIFTFVGPVHHPAIVNQTTGKTLSVAADLATSSDSIVVDTYARSAIILPAGNVGRQYISGDFWTMPIGTSVINLTTTNGGDVGKCIVLFRDTYLGV